jgi:cytochrome c oxidase subunit 2
MNLRKLTIALAAMSLFSAAPWAVPETPERIEITASKFAYSPHEITLKRGQQVTLVFHTADVTHGFKLPELNIKSEIHKGQDTEITITPTQTGQFVGKCAHFCGKGHGSMTLLVNVVN